MKNNLKLFIPYGNPPKKKTNKIKNNTIKNSNKRQKAFNYNEDYDIDDEDDDNENYEQQLIKQFKKKQIKIPREINYKTTKYDDNDDDDYLQTYQNKNKQKKKNNVLKYKYNYDDDFENYVPKKNSSVVSKKRPQTSTTKYSTTNKKKNVSQPQKNNSNIKNKNKKPKKLYIYKDDDDDDEDEEEQEESEEKYVPPPKKKIPISAKPKKTTKYNNTKINKKNYNPFKVDKNKKIVSKKPIPKKKEDDEEEEEESQSESQSQSQSGYLSKIKGAIKKQDNNAKLINLFDNYNESNDKHRIGNIITKYTGKKIEIKNKKQAQKVKRKIEELFATKKKDDDDDDEDEDEENEEIDKNSKQDSKIDNINILLEKINDCNYQEYNYDIKDEDYFEINGKKWETILNSEDAAIKKCEEIFNSIGNSKFIDTEFGSQPNDEGKLNKFSLYGKIGPSQNDINPAHIEWYSIDQISIGEAKFFDDGVESNDVIQGRLGDCWFLSALSVIATKDYLLRGEFSESILDDGIIDDEETVMLSTGVYPPIFHTFRTKGIFCFKFYKNFKWRYVIIDDRLPCFKQYQQKYKPVLIYGHCRQPNEFWVPLIEKAYAKIHGSYKSLESGFIYEGLFDLTGLSGKKVEIEEDILNDKKKTDELWKFLMETNSIGFADEKEQKTKSGKTVTAKIFTRNKSMMGCRCTKNKNVGKGEEEVIIDNNHSGLFANHAYGILDVFELPKPRGRKRKISRLLRIKNPWGRKEWNGKWSDNSEEIIKNEERIKEILEKKYEGTNEKIDLGHDDGAFLMCFSDFRNIFKTLYICENYKPSFIGIRLYSKWTEIDSGGLPLNNTPQEFADFTKNPQFYFSMAKEGKMIINLIQNDGRLTGEKFSFKNSVKSAALILFSTNNEKKVENFNNEITKTRIIQTRIRNLEINLPKGEYIVIPATKYKGEYADYCLEFFFEDKLKKKSKKGKNFILDRLQNVKIKKLGGEKVDRIELIDINLASEINEAKENKKEFMYYNFKNCLLNDDDVNYDIVNDDEEDEEDEDDEFI